VKATLGVLLVAVVLALAAAAVLQPRWLRPPAPRPAQLGMPRELAHGSRASGMPPATTVPMRATVAPTPARLGERLLYRGSVIVSGGRTAGIRPPQTAGDLSWGRARTGTTSGLHPSLGLLGEASDSVWIEVPLQVFTTGQVAIPGPAVTLAGPGTAGRVTNLPNVYLYILPTVTAQDSAATLRPLRGPLGAPWWERVPWLLVSAALLGIAIAFAIANAISARRRRSAPLAPLPATPQRGIGPGAEALAALARLREQRLLAQGRFGDHALALTSILRRYLERSAGTLRPGDTSGELVERMRVGPLGERELAELTRMLGLWDRIKFARASVGVGEAESTERALEELVRGREPGGAAA